MIERKAKKSSLNLEYLLRTRRYLMVSIAISLCCVVLFFMITLPRIQSIQSTRQSLSKELKKLEKLEKKRSILENTSSIDVFTQKDRIDALLPSGKPVLPLLQRLEQVSRDTKVIVSEFGVSPGEISTGSAKPASSSKSGPQHQVSASVETKVTVLGSIEDIHAFLRQIKLISPMTDISDLAMKAVNQRNSGGTSTTASLFEVSLTLQTYFFNKQLQTKADQELPDIERISQDVIDEIQAFNISTQFNPSGATQVQGGGKNNLFE